MTPHAPTPFRIISMVPSWTEMLLSLGIPLVGRTRFCIEPTHLVKTIPAVGGTKDWNLEHVRSLEPNLIILDKDENPKSMSEGHSWPIVATHVQNISSCLKGIQLISQSIPTARASFQTLIDRWQLISLRPPLTQLSVFKDDDLPGLIEWVKKPRHPIKTVYYVIWKNPWMIATSSTFIGDVAQKVGLPLSAPTLSSRYPEIDLNGLDPDTTLLLFSSEPYPFHKKTNEIKSLPFSSAIVDGQAFSWFGVHSLQFLENTFRVQPK